MSRSTKINIEVNNHKAISSIKELRKAFKDLKDSKDSVGKNGKIKLNVDVKYSGIDIATLQQISKSIGSLGSKMQKLESVSNKFNKLGTVFNLTTNNIKDSIVRTTQVTDDYSRSMNILTKNLVMSIGLFKMLSTSTSDYLQLTSNVFSVGIASQMNIGQIDNLSTSFINLSKVVPATAMQLSESVDSLIRTGRSFSESKKIIEQVALLSTASGDSLKDTSQVVTKVMTSLNISANNVVETLNTMHSTAIQTASDMGFLSEAFKNVAGVTNVLVSSSGLAGKELDNYKQKVLDVSMAMIGSLANTGLSASTAGNKVKVFFNKMVAGEKASRALFNTSMRLNDVLLENGKLFTFDDLSELTKKDLPKALELMSKFYAEGKLGTQTLQKMFTARHFMEISNLLLQINGDVDGFVNGIAKGVSYTQDFYKAMFDINNQWQQLKNNAFAGTAGIFGSLKDTSTGLMMIGNLVGHVADNGFTKWAGYMTTIYTTTLGLTLGFKTMGKVLKSAFKIDSAKSFLSVLTSINPVVAGVTISIGLLGKMYYDFQKSIADSVNNLTQFSSVNKKISNQISVIEASMKSISVYTKDVNKNWMSLEIENASTMLGVLLKQIQNYSNAMSGIRNIQSVTGVSSLSSDAKEDFRKAKEQYSDLVKSQTQLMNKSLGSTIQNINRQREQIWNAMELDFAGTIKQLESQKKLLDSSFDGRIKNAKTLVELMQKYVGWNKENETLQHKMYSEAEKLNIPKSEVNAILRIYDNKEFVERNGKLADLSALMEQYSKDVAVNMKKVQDIMASNIKSLNMWNAQLSESRLELFKLTGEFNKFDKTGKLIGTYKGKQGVIELFRTSEFDVASDKLKVVQDKIEELQNVENTLNNKRTQWSKEEQARFNETQNTLKKLNEERERIKKTTESIAQIEEKQYLNALKGVDLNKRTENIVYKILSAQFTLSDMVEHRDMYTEEIIEKQKRELANQQKIGQIVTQQERERKNNSTYQLKYTNRLKDSLNVELETAKVGKAKADQELLIYQYKLKQLEIDKQISDNSLSVAKESLKTAKVGSFGNYRSMLFDDGKLIENQRHAQSVLDKIFKENDRVRKGQAGAEEKSFVDFLSKYIQALGKSEKITQEIIMTPRKALTSFISTELPRLNEQIADSVQKSFDLTGISFKNTDKMNMEMLQSDLENFVKRANLGGLLNAPISVLNGMIAQSQTQVESLSLQAESNPTENNIEAYKQEEAHLKNLIELQKQKLKIAERELKTQLAVADVYKDMGNLLSKMGSTFGMKGLDKVGGLLTNLGDVSKSFTNLGSDFSIKGLFDMQGSDFSKGLSNLISSAMSNMDMGSTVGSIVGGITGGGASAQAGGAIGGLAGAMGGASALAGAMGLADPTGASLAISAVGSLVGSLFADDGSGQREAEEKTKKANKLYEKNTDALNKLAQNMANLSGGIDGLNSSLVSSFSKLPTFNNLTDVTSAMKDMYATMEKTRKFNEVAYQVTHHKKGKKGFMGIGSTADTSWTETIKVPVQQLINQFGFRGTIDDMSSDQMRRFSEWLDDYDMGESDNFSVLASAIEDYAEALDKMGTNIDKFFSDTTLESFVGISSLQQEELRQQIEDFYKSLGFQIDEEMTKTINDLANEMSVMVTIMQDVRGQFVNSWRDSGKTAGKAFLTSMTPYIDAMLNNLSQIFYDVYFSDVTDSLNKEFKVLSEKLVELKKQGASLDWHKVGDEISLSFDKVIKNITLASTESESFTTILMQLQKQALDAGLSLSEILEIGLTSGTQQTVLSSFKDAILSSDSETAFTSIGDMLGDTVGKAMADKLIDNLLSQRVLEFSKTLDKVINSDMNFNSLAQLSSEALEIGVMLDDQQRRLSAIKDMFSFSDVEYESQETNIEYSSGVSSSITNNYYITSEVNAGAIIEADDVQTLARELLEEQLEILKTEKGINITKNY